MSADLKENYYALMVATEKGISMEQAFGAMENSKLQKRYHNTTITPDDVRAMIAMQEQDMTLADIGAEFGISKFAVFNRIKRYKEENE